MQRQILINVMIFFAYALNLPLNTQRPHHRSQHAGKLGLDFGSWQSPDISRSHLYRGTFPWTPPTAIYRAYTVIIIVSYLLWSIFHWLDNYILITHSTFLLQDKMNMSCVSSSAVQELMRCIRGQMDSLITGLPQRELSAMALGLAHRWGAMRNSHIGPWEICVSQPHQPYHTHNIKDRFSEHWFR